MDWNQGLFVAFMAAVQGTLLWIALELRQIRRDELPVKRNVGDSHKKDGLENLPR